ncbi:ABC transporter substrate-binding protein [Parafrankia sp. FMc2]|uniref:ABC transporter substrate-binding protein n=1 Tax=Parafrankia sp. FMc2 TaxID=3233196 RepID=UPI0034D709CB
MRKHGLAGPLGLAAALAVAAVTSCSTPGAGAEANIACDTPGVTADHVNLGFVFSNSGVGSEALSSARSGVDARLGLANANGGVHGRTVVYDWRDDGSSSTANERMTTDLVQQQSVFGLLMVSSATGGSPERLAREGIPVVGLPQTDFAKYPNWFSQLYDASPEIIGRYLTLRGSSKVAIVTTGSAQFVQDFARRYAAAFQEVGLPTAEIIPFASGSDSPRQIARRIAASGADSLVGFTTLDDFAQVSQAVRESRVELAASVSLSGYDRSTLSRLGEQLIGVSFPVYFHPFEGGGPAIETYREAMGRFAPETGQPDQQFAMYGYIYADMFLRGLELAGDCPTRESFISSLRNVPDYDAGGLIEPIDLRTNATTPLPCSAFVEIDPTGTAFAVAQEQLCVDGAT